MMTLGECANAFRVADVCSPSWHRHGGRGQQASCAWLSGMVVGLGFMRAAALLGATTPFPHRYALRSAGVSMAIAFEAARMARAEAEIATEEGARPRHETALLWHLELRGAWRQGVVCWSEECQAVCWSHAPVWLLLGGM